MRTLQNCLYFGLVLTLIACGNEKKEPKTVTVDNEAPITIEASEETTSFNDAKMEQVFDQYLEVKNALVQTDKEATQTAASNLLTAFANIGVSEKAFMAGQAMVEAEDVEAQREAFVVVTAEVETLLEGALSEGAVYKQYCPMAFNNTGAYWLSDSKEIYNPYFGDKMLRCGRVDSKIE
ncbi:DUF3347 domain-containing protein [Altibacter sp. HG106]|uniref:DUF3347 domain-containing protein n=1 Tax=Altibacter sp. HG106 TaxID=3023937 RepID=UPI0023506379|nr:DUF3347 domain-containing protein [Altibacter sp. HG106]MDC7994297.1 DUF3347 domain-containing protein [Altibacter sp. HG106]